MDTPTIGTQQTVTLRRTMTTTPVEQGLDNKYTFMTTGGIKVLAYNRRALQMARICTGRTQFEDTGVYDLKSELHAVIEFRGSYWKLVRVTGRVEAVTE